MRKLTLVLIATAIPFTALAGVARAAEGAVDLTTCAGDGGSAVVPAGVPVAVEIAWLDSSSSLVRHFQRLQTTTASHDGVPIASASDLWGPSTNLGGAWATTWSYSVGVLDQPGDSAVVSLDIALDKKLRSGDKSFYGPGSVTEGTITCTITAV
jgi:hypothetical protein